MVWLPTQLLKVNVFILKLKCLMRFWSLYLSESNIALSSKGSMTFCWLEMQYDWVVNIYNYRVHRHYLYSMYKRSLWTEVDGDAKHAPSGITFHKKAIIINRINNSSLLPRSHANRKGSLTEQRGVLMCICLHRICNFNRIRKLYVPGHKQSAL